MRVQQDESQLTIHIDVQNEPFLKNNLELIFFLYLAPIIMGSQNLT